MTLKTEDLMLGRQLPTNVAVCPLCSAPLLASIPYSYTLMNINKEYNPNSIVFKWNNPDGIVFKCVRNVMHRSTVDKSPFVEIVNRIKHDCNR
jgi:hypothetical protein